MKRILALLLMCSIGSYISAIDIGGNMVYTCERTGKKFIQHGSGEWRQLFGPKKSESENASESTEEESSSESSSSESSSSSEQEKQIASLD